MHVLRHVEYVYYLELSVCVKVYILSEVNLKSCLFLELNTRLAFIEFRFLHIPMLAFIVLFTVHMLLMHSANTHLLSRSRWPSRLHIYIYDIYGRIQNTYKRHKTPTPVNEYVHNGYIYIYLKCIHIDDNDCWRANKQTNKQMQILERFYTIKSLT